MKQFALGILFGMLLGIGIQARCPGMFRSWHDDSTLYRGDKVTLHLESPHAEFYKNCKAIFLMSQAVEQDNLAWVLLTQCDFQKSGEFGDPMTDTFRLRDLERAK